MGWSGGGRDRVRSRGWRVVEGERGRLGGRGREIRGGVVGVFARIGMNWDGGTCEWVGRGVGFFEWCVWGGCCSGVLAALALRYPAGAEPGHGAFSGSASGPGIFIPGKGGGARLERRCGAWGEAGVRWRTGRVRRW